MGSRESVHLIQRIYKILRKVQVEVTLFNESNANLVFGMKVVMISVTIVCGFSAVQFFHVQHLIGAMNFIVVINGMAIFSVTYDRGFSIPRRVAQLKSSLSSTLKLVDLMTEDEKATILRKLGSVGLVAIRVGHFHHLQRVSTPNFVDFCVKNMARMVIAYRKNVLN